MARRHANGVLPTGTAARRAAHPRTAEPRGEGEGERRSPTGIARERETSVDHAAPYQRADRTTFESRSARPLAAPATQAVPSDRHRGPEGRATRIAHCEEARGRLGTPTSGQSSRWGPAPLGEAQRTAPRPATATCSPPADPATATCSPADPATATCSAPTDPATATCSPADPATATCSPPPDPATATCSPGRSGYCDMFASTRPRYSDMFPGQIRLLRHVRPQPIPLERHVPRQIRLLRHVRLQPTPCQETPTFTHLGDTYFYALMVPEGRAASGVSERAALGRRGVSARGAARRKERSDRNAAAPRAETSARTGRGVTPRVMPGIPHRSHSSHASRSGRRSSAAGTRRRSPSSFSR